MTNSKYMAGLPKHKRKTHKREIRKSKKKYAQNKYYTRKKIPEYKHRKSSHVTRAKEIYNIESIKPSKKLSKKTKCTLKGLREIVAKGKGAYYSSGSRANQTPSSWGIARLASALTGGPSSKYDQHILKKECKSNSMPMKLFRKNQKGGGKRKKRMKERIVTIKKSNRKEKKYMAIVKNIKTNVTRIIHFGASDYPQYKDRTTLKLYKRKNHNDRKRMRNYFSRHSGISNRNKAIYKEKNKSNYYYTPKILSHIYLW